MFKNIVEKPQNKEDEKGFLNFNFLGIVNSAFDIVKSTVNAVKNTVTAVKNTVVETYQTFKEETINLFKASMLKKIFSSGNTLKFNSNTDSIISLSKHVEHLKRTIESSKVFIRAIIEKVRYQGKIKIINELNKNPQHPEYQSSFPDLFTVTPKPNNQNSFYPFTRLDENFDLEGRKNILQNDRSFKERMNKSIQESYVNNFINNNNNSWQVSDQLISLKNIRSTIKHFQKNYENLKFSNKLDKDFMMDSYSSLFIINDNLISIDQRNKMIRNFQEIIPNANLQQLISTYANQKFIHQSYLQLISENPEINQYQLKNSRNIYKINNLDDGSIKLVATHLSDLDIKNNNFIQKYKSFGIRATIIIPPNNLPIIKYSHFIK